MRWNARARSRLSLSLSLSCRAVVAASGVKYRMDASSRVVSTVAEGLRVLKEAEGRKHRAATALNQRCAGAAHHTPKH